MKGLVEKFNLDIFIIFAHTNALPVLLVGPGLLSFICGRKALLKAGVSSRVSWHDRLRVKRHLSSPHLLSSLLTPQLGRPYVIILFVVHPDVGPALSQAAALTLVAGRKAVRIELASLAALDGAMVTIVDRFHLGGERGKQEQEGKQATAVTEGSAETDGHAHAGRRLHRPFRLSNSERGRN